MLLNKVRVRQSRRESERAKGKYVPSFLFVEFVTHVLGEPLELSLRAGVVGINHKVLEVPKSPTKVLEPLALLEEASDLGADLGGRS